ncbi:MAG: hypothetical protein SFY69_03935 [Planctomycetota bacterium]|nr:hypothetical protein [Planctomycetota bacterium]
MGTSNWQQIPFCIEALMKMAPERVLDVGVGFGRWGIITREFCDVWYSRIFKEDWKIHIEGIEAFPKSLSAYHREFYNVIHTGDAAKVIPTLAGPWSVVIFGDVLEHFDKPTANRLLEHCLAHSEYVLVNIPLGEEHEQGAAYGNEYERHLSSWDIPDFAGPTLVRHVELRDYIGRPYGSFILSRADPKNLRAGLFAPVSIYNDDEGLGAERDELERLLDRAGDQAFELSFIKNTRLYKAGTRLRRSPVGRVLARSSERTVTIRATGTRNASSGGSEVWILHASGAEGERSVPWDYVTRDHAWSLRDDPARPHGKHLVTQGPGEAFIKLGDDPELRLLRHPWSGNVEIEFRGRRETIDLYHPVGDVIRVFPARTPMAPALDTPLPAPTPRPAASTAHANGHAPAAPAPSPARAFSDVERAFIERVRAASPAAIAVTCPRYMGVTSSTVNLFEHTYLVPGSRADDPEALTEDDLRHHARVIVETRAPRVVISGGDHRQHRLMQLVREAAPRVRCDLFFHGSYPQFSEDYVWQIFKMWVESARRGDVYSIASDKFGYDRFVRSLGLRGHVLLNRIEGPLLDDPNLPDSPRHVGLWLSGTTYRKLPHAMLAALKMMPDTLLHGAGLDARSREVIEFLDIPTAFAQERHLPHEELFTAMRRTHLTMYVTFIECCPMLPLESLHQGVPALTGPNSHLFDDNPFLFERLVVPFPDRAEVIADYAERAIRERREIIAEYQRYWPTYDARAKNSVREFLNG